MIVKDWLEQGNHLFEICALETNTLENKQAYEDFLNLSIDDNTTKLEWICPTCRESHIATLKDKIIDLKRCPTCYKDKPVLKVNESYGCLTVVGSPFEFMREYSNRRIANIKKENENLEAQRQSYLDTGIDFNNTTNNVNFYDNKIKSNKNKLHKLESNFGYFVQCTCGYKLRMFEDDLFAHERKYCTEPSYTNGLFRPRPICGQVICKHIKDQQLNLKNSKFYDYYDNNIYFNPGDIFESLKIDKFKCTTYSCIRKPTKTTKGIAKTTRWYNCTCYLCGQTYIYNNYDFEIITHNGKQVSANAKCDCHQYSYLQWQPTDILNKLHIPYRVEIGFNDLLGSSGKYLLTYDFGILDNNNNIKALLEVQGSQHDHFCKELQESEYDFKKQQLHDKLKRDYAIKHNIPLIELPNIYDYKEIINILVKNNIINKPIDIKPTWALSIDDICKKFNNNI